MSLTHAISLHFLGSDKLLARLFANPWRRNLRMGSGLVLFTYITAHFVNHALGLISLSTAEEGLGYAEYVWDSLPGTVVLYGAAAVHFMLALWAIYERRTFRLPPAELLRRPFTDGPDHLIGELLGSDEGDPDIGLAFHHRMGHSLHEVRLSEPGIPVEKERVVNTSRRL